MKTENQKWYDYRYEGEWTISNLKTGEFIRTEVIQFHIECEYPPSVWNKMEEDNTDEFSDLISEGYSEVEVDYDTETEIHEGNEEWWRKW
tara:strand:+ start:163 stop:432 length:270 start_codon:yes stop_codon:yes gene_type:complete